MTEGFLDQKISKADFQNSETTLTPKQYEKVVRFLRYHNPPTPDDPVNTIIVPTTSPYFDMESFRKRLDASLLYSRLYPTASIIFTGKRPDLSRAVAEERVENYSEASVMSKTAVNEGLGQKRVVLEELSTNTSESIANVFELLKEKPLGGILVTCSSYMARRIDYYIKRELRNRSLAGKVKVFIFDADVAEDLEGKLTSDESSDRKRRSILYEAKRLSKYRNKRDL